MLGGYWFSVKESLIPSVPHQKFAAEFDAIWAASLCWRNALIGPLSRQFTALKSNPSDAVFYCTECLTRDTRRTAQVGSAVGVLLGLGVAVALGVGVGVAVGVTDGGKQI